MTTEIDAEGLAHAMTDTIDVAALVERLTDKAVRFGPNGELERQAATALQSQADALAEARRDVNKYAYERDKAREERDAAERRSEAFWKPQLDKATDSLATMREALAEAALQIEHLHEKLGKQTASGNSVLAMIRRALGGSNAE